MKVKTSELKGNALCYAVCLIELPHLVWNETIGLHHASDQVVVPSLPSPDCYSPFTSWGMVGPIIEREEISIRVNRPCSAGREWEASPSITAKGAGGRWGYGPSPLIAAMRCYVASKLGDTVEIPDELIGKE